MKKPSVGSRRYHLPKADDPGLAKCGATFIDPGSKRPVEYIKENFEVLLCKRCFRERRQPSKQAKPENFVTNEEPAKLTQARTVKSSLNAITSVYQLKITLMGVRPQVWRRFQVPETTTLAQLHSVIQAVMGWEGYHLHQFSDSEDETLTLVAAAGR